MKRFRIAATAAVLALTLALVAPSLPSSGTAPVANAPTSLRNLEGRGLWATLECTSCMAGAETLMLTGTTQLAPLAALLGPHLLASCIGVCAMSAL